MPSRRAVILSIAPLAGLAGCLHSEEDSTGGDGGGTGDDDGTGDDGASGDDGQAAGPHRLGTWAAVTDRTETRPTDVRFADSIRFDGGPGADDVVWEPRSGHQFALVEIERLVTSAPADELVAFPDPFAYRLEIDDAVYEPRAGPAETTVIDEPLEFGGYASRGSSGAEGVSTTDWIAFEIPADVAARTLVLEYVDGEDVHRWSPTD